MMSVAGGGAEVRVETEVEEVEVASLCPDDELIEVLRWLEVREPHPNVALALSLSPEPVPSHGRRSGTTPTPHHPHDNTPRHATHTTLRRARWTSCSGGVDLPPLARRRAGRLPVGVHALQRLRRPCAAQLEPCVGGGGGGGGGEVQPVEPRPCVVGAWSGRVVGRVVGAAPQAAAHPMPTPHARPTCPPHAHPHAHPTCRPQPPHMPAPHARATPRSGARGAAPPLPLYLPTPYTPYIRRAAAPLPQHGAPWRPHRLGPPLRATTCSAARFPAVA